MEQDNDANLIALTVAKDEVEELTSRLREYDSAAKHLGHISELRAKIEDLEGKLGRSQDLVASYQVCTRF
jgi:hypothetical protein